jgi:hypothetical protein
MVDLFANRNEAPIDTMGLISDEELMMFGSQSDSPFASIGDTIRTEMENVAQGDFSGVSTLLEDNLSGVFTVAMTAIGMLFGGPLGIVTGLARLFMSAVESDFMGIGTMLEESTIVQSIRDGLEGIFSSISNIFGGGEDAPVDIAGYIPPELLGGGGNPLSGIISEVTETFAPISDLFNSDLLDPIRTLGEGLVGFFDNVAGANWQGFVDAAVALWDNFVLPLIQANIVLGLSLLSGFLTGIGNALPHLGDAIASFVNIFGELGEGDLMGAFLELIGGIGDLGNTIGSFVVGSADGIISFLENLTGMEFMSVSEGFGAMVNALTGLRDDFVDTFDLNIIINRATQMIDRFVLTFQEAWVGLLEMTGQDSTAARASLDETLGRIETVGLGLGANDMLRDQLSQGQINLWDMISLDVGGEEVSMTLLDALSDPAIVSTLGGQAQTLLDDALALASENADVVGLSELITAGFQSGLEIDPSTIDLSSIISASDYGVIDAAIIAQDFDAAGIDVVSLLGESINNALASGDLVAAEGLIDASVLFGGEDAITGIADGIDEQLLNTFADLSVDSLIGELGMDEDSALQIGTDITAGLVQGIADGRGDLETETQGIVEDVQGTIEDGFQVQSPSVYMQNIGDMLMQGLTLGMQNGMITIDPILAHIASEGTRIGTVFMATGLKGS